MTVISAFTRKYAELARVLDTSIQITAPRANGHTNSESPVFFKAIWDTGATNSVISDVVVKALNLLPIGKVEVHTAGGSLTANVYLVNITLPNNITVPNVRVSEGIIQGSEMLIGMDIISLGDFSVTNMNGRTTMSFRVPSCSEIDYVRDVNNAQLPRTERRRLEKEAGKVKKVLDST